MAEPAMTIREQVRAWWNGDRAYRFDGEESNHADQRRQTETSIGLMAAAASAPDPTDAQRLQALQTEHMLQARKTVLDAKRAERGLTMEERYELESINRGLTDLLGPAPVALETHGGQRLAQFGDVGQRRGFLGAIPAVAGVAVRPWMLWSGALAAVALWGGYNDVRAGRAENARDEAQAELAAKERTIADLQRNQEQLAEMVQAADAQSRANAAAVEAERNRRTRTERELRRIRNATQEATEGGRIDYGIPADGGVRDAGETP